MKLLLTILISTLLFSCAQTELKTDEKWKTIEIGNYLFDFPTDFELITEQGIDSYVGKIKGDSMSFYFDFGYYSNNFEQTTKEYLDNGEWRYYLSYRFMKESSSYNQINTPKVDILEIRPATINDSAIGKGCDYVAKCKHNTTEFDVAVYIPNEIKQTNYAIDTANNQYRKIVWAKDPRKGRTGIYIKDLNGFNSSINSYLALSMETDNLSVEQQELALKIFKSGRHKNEPK
jgi:hypothetical protein